MFLSFVDDVLIEDSETESDPQVNSAVIRVVTSPDFRSDGKRIVETLEAVHAIRVIAMGPISDIKALFRDAVGGRSRTIESTFKKAREEVIADLRKQAARYHAHAVVSLRLETGELNQSVLFVAASGTPVMLSDSA